MNQTKPIRTCERCQKQDNQKDIDVKAYYVAEAGLSSKRFYCVKCFIEYSNEQYKANSREQ